MIALIFPKLNKIQCRAQKKPNATLVCSPGMGHLIPMLELGKRLVINHNFTVTIFAVASQASTPGESQIVRSFMINRHLCNIIDLPVPVDISEKVHHDYAVVTQIAITMREIKLVLRSTISSMNHEPTTNFTHRRLLRHRISIGIGR